MSGSLSTKIGFAPTYNIELAYAENVRDWQITSSSFPTPKRTNARCKAAVPELSAAQVKEQREKNKDVRSTKHEVGSEKLKKSVKIRGICENPCERKKRS